MRVCEMSLRPKDPGNWPRSPAVPGETVLYAGRVGEGGHPDPFPWTPAPEVVPAVPVPDPLSRPLYVATTVDIEAKLAELMDELRTLRQAVERGHREREIFVRVVRVLLPDLAESEVAVFAFERLPRMVGALVEQGAAELKRADAAERDLEAARADVASLVAAVNEVRAELAAKVEALAKSQAALNEARGKLKALEPRPGEVRCDPCDRETTEDRVVSVDRKEARYCEVCGDVSWALFSAAVRARRDGEAVEVCRAIIAAKS